MNTPERQADHPIDPLFLRRWSPRSFTTDEIPQEVLAQLFEAARWAPSAYNYQPWRFLYARRGDALWDAYVKLLTPVNQVWAFRASALVYVLSDSRVARPGHPEKESFTHVFDAGCAWGYLSVQATLLGWHTHCMQGFDGERAHSVLAIPDRFRVDAAIAIGKQGPAPLLPEDLQAREQPSGRRPVKQTASSGLFPAEWA